MSEPEKPFACIIPDCRMTFTNEDHLNVHTKKHDMVLQLGLEQKGTTFVADQTPTPTRFIRNCEEVGLFQDLQNVNPFDETFKRAMEAKSGIALENALSGHDDALHTPNIFPNLTVESPSTIYNGATDLRTNMTIHRSSSEETSNLTVKCLTSLDRNISSETDAKMINKETLEDDTISSDEKSESLNNGNVNKNHSGNVTTVTDSVVTMNIINNTNYEIRHGDLNSKSISENEKMLLKTNQIPVISITETSEHGDVLIATEEDSTFQNTSVSVIKKDVMLTATTKNTDLHLGSEIKKNYLELVSQKSLDMAIDSLNSLKNDHKSVDDDKANNETNSTETHAIMSDSQIRSNLKIVLTNTTETIDSTIMKAKKDTQELNNQLRKTQDTRKPVSKGLKRKNASNVKELHLKQQIVQNDKSEQNDQYEILLKLPSGKTVHMKSIDDNNAEYKSQVDVKSALRTALSSKVKESKEKNVAINKNLPLIVNNANNTGNIIVSGGNTPVQLCQVMPNSANILMPTVPQYITIGNPNLNVPKQAFLSPVPIIIQNPNLPSIASFSNANVSTVTAPKTQDGVRNSMDYEKNTGSDKVKCKVSYDLQHRRNAVRRYRARQKLKRAHTMQRNEMLREENERLGRQLSQAQIEIERLASIVSLHRNCLPVLTDHRNHQSHNSVARIVEAKNCNVTITSNVIVASNHTYVNNPGTEESKN